MTGEQRACDPIGVSLELGPGSLANAAPAQCERTAYVLGLGHALSSEQRGPAEAQGNTGYTSHEPAIGARLM